MFVYEVWQGEAFRFYPTLKEAQLDVGDDQVITKLEIQDRFTRQDICNLLNNENFRVAIVAQYTKRGRV